MNEVFTKLQLLLCVVPDFVYCYFVICLFPLKAFTDNVVSRSLLYPQVITFLIMCLILKAALVGLNAYIPSLIVKSS